tara:strand:- start:1028 stop:1129 length:102 start_codon:yes stop_codon:yes gene_type:complete
MSYAPPRKTRYSSLRKLEVGKKIWYTGRVIEVF